MNGKPSLIKDAQYLSIRQNHNRFSMYFLPCPHLHQIAARSEVLKVHLMGIQSVDCREWLLPDYLPEDVHEGELNLMGKIGFKAQADRFLH